MNKKHSNRLIRVEQLKQLEAVSKNKISFFISQKGFGRKEILKKFSEENKSLILDIKKISTSPENFAIDYILKTAQFFCAEKNTEKYQNLNDLKEKINNKSALSIINTIINELEKIKPNQELILQNTFSFPYSLSNNTKNNQIIFENAEELLKLNNFSGVKDIISLLEESINKSNQKIILSTANVNLCKNIAQKKNLPFFEMPPISREEAILFTENICGKTDSRILDFIYLKSGGSLTLLQTLCERFNNEKAKDANKNLEVLNYIYISELSHTSAKTYSFCSTLFTESLNRARGDALLKTIIKAISNQPALRLSEIARLIYRSGPVTKSLLERLIEVDLLKKSDKTFEFQNPVLKDWCSLMFEDIEFEQTPSINDLKDLGLIGGVLR